MASAGIGGVPTTTKRTHTRTGTASDEVLYTCPANTRSIVSLDSMRKSGAIQSAGLLLQLRRQFPSGNNIDSTIMNKGWPISINLSESVGVTANMNADDFISRFDQPPSLNLAGNRFGQFVMFPGDELIATQTGGPGATLELIYYTTEVSSNS